MFNLIKKLIFLLLFTNLFFSAKSQRVVKEDEMKRAYGVRLTGMKCKNYDNLTAFISKCFIKPYRNFTTFNFAYVVVKPLIKPVYLQVIAQYRYGTIFRDIIDTHKRDWCEAIENVDTNPFLRMIYRHSVGLDNPNMPKKCPITKSAEFLNITMGNVKATDRIWWPEGAYKFIFKFYKFNEMPLFEVMYKIDMKSPVKSSFG